MDDDELDSDSELDSTWEQLLQTNPQRLVDIFDLNYDSTGQKNKWGDTIDDIEPVKRCIRFAVKIRARSSEWDGLVRSGIIDKLCECVTGTRKTFRRRPVQGSPGEPISFHSIYYEPMRYLIMACKRFGFESPSTTANVKGSLRRHWKDMARRLWNDPDQTEDPRASMAYERANICLLVDLACGHSRARDRAFMTMLREDDDLTTRVGFRYWINSTTPVDFRIMERLLYSIYNITDADEDEILGPLFTKFHREMHAGCKSFQRSVAKIEWSLTHLHKEDITLSSSTIPTIFLLFQHSIQNRTMKLYMTAEPDLVHAFLKRKGLWKAIFEHLVFISRDTSIPGVSRPYSMVASRTLHCVADVLAATRREVTEESSDFCRALVQAGMFNALEDAIPRFASSIDLSFAMEKLLGSLLLVSERHPFLYRSLREQLPRPRILRALLDAAYVGPEKPTPPRFIPSSILPVRDGPNMMNYHICPWFYLDLLRLRAEMDKECSRRGCKKRRKARCKACKNTGYCGFDCQKRDWDEHRLICGFGHTRSPSNVRRQGFIETVTYPARMPVAHSGYIES